MFRILVATLILFIGFGFSQRAQVELILDLSGSMWLELESGEMKIDAAKSALKEIIPSLPDDINVGLRVYGATVSGIDPDACTDSQKILPIAELDRDLLLTAIETREPKGGTPIVFALDEAIQDFEVLSSAQKRIILVTDGQESCGQDLEAAVQRLSAQGIDLQVIGFGLSERASSAFEGLAFTNTFSSNELTTALSETIQDLQPVNTTAPETTIQEADSYEVNVDITVTPATSTAATDTPNIVQTDIPNDYAVNVEIITTNSGLSIVDISGPEQLNYNAAPTIYFLHWQGDVSSPLATLTVQLTDIACDFNGQAGGCIFQSTPVESFQNPIPLAISCADKFASQTSEGFWRNEIVLIDSLGNASLPYLLEIECVL